MRDGRSNNRDCYMGFRVTKDFAPLGLVAGERLVVPMPTGHLTVLGRQGPDRTCRQVPVDHRGAVLQAMLNGHLESTDGILMDVGVA